MSECHERLLKTHDGECDRTLQVRWRLAVLSQTRRTCKTPAVHLIGTVVSVHDD